MNPTIAIIGGTGLTDIAGLQIKHREMVRTPYGIPSGPLIHGELHGADVVFLRRHGMRHNIPPHKVNYRANIWALQKVGIERVIAIAAVGGISAAAMPGRLVFPDQIIDYTHSRGSTFFENDLARVTHIDFTWPYSAELRDLLTRASQDAKLDALNKGVYAATQGPRLETAAEIQKLERDGCTIVGMTGMPEAALARELGLEYANCAVVANYAAGKQNGPITAQEIETNLKTGMEKVRELLRHLVTLSHSDSQAQPGSHS